ncbi:MAG: hypothetical protein V4692_12815, partial [Bdellovibrionota bacterium]
MSFFVGLLCFALGWVLSREIHPAAPLIPSPAAIERDQKTEDLLRASAKDIELAQTSEQRQKKIEELLEKVFKLFMIELSLRVKNGEPVPPTLAENAPAIASPTPAPVFTESPAKQTQFMKIGEDKIKTLEVTVIEGDLSKALASLRELGKGDFNDGFKNAKDLSQEQAESLIGEWSGRVRMFEETVEPWRVRITVDHSAKSTSEKPLYKYRITVNKNPKARDVSTTSGEGNLKHFSKADGETTPMFLEAVEDRLAWTLLA